jgi:NADH-quinone oxidoreductase subunit N
MNYLALLPLLILAYFATLLMVLVAFWRSHAFAFWATLVGLAAAFVTLPFGLTPTPEGPLIELDRFSIYFTALIIAGAFLVILYSRDYLEAHERSNSAFYVLLMLAVLGMAVIASSTHFASFFLGLETLSVSLFGLIGYTRDHKPSLEASLKYLVISAAATAFLLFGIALMYMDSGTMDFRLLGHMLSTGSLTIMSYFGLAMVLVVFGFKLAIAPFHMWSPDVYQGAPSPVTALIATGSKGAVLALLLRFVTTGHLQADHTVYLTITVLAIATMFVGNLLALLQTNVKRLLAYSSIAHMGYLLIPLLAGGVSGPPSIAFYLATYFATTILAFGVISVLSGSPSRITHHASDDGSLITHHSSPISGDLDQLDDYRGLSSRHPILAAVFALSLLSLTGIPPTAGFIAKFYIFSAAAQSGLWTLLIIGIINSGISAFYYLRLLVAMYVPSESPHPPLSPSPPRLASAISLCVTTAVLLIFGVYPSPLIHLAQSAMSKLAF